MKHLCISVILIAFINSVQAQNVGINTTSPDTSAALDVYATDKGFLMPRVTTAQMNAIVQPANGLAVYNTDSSSVCIYAGSQWLKVILSSSISSSTWTQSGSNQYSAVSGNVGIGTSSPSNKLDIQSSSSVAANVQSTGSNAYVNTVSPSGQEASFNFKTYSSGTNYNRWLFGKSNTSESGSNTGSDFFINRYSDAGSYSGQPFFIKRSTGYVGINKSSPSYSLDVSGTAKADSVNTTYFKMSNGAVSGYILQSDSSGNAGWVSIGSTTGAVRYVGNSYLGITSGYGSSGSSEGTKSNLRNIYLGDNAGSKNTTGTANVAIGYAGMTDNTTGNYNIAVGGNSLRSNTSGEDNAALGYSSMYKNTTGSDNTACGAFSLYNNTTGTSNVAMGYSANMYNTTGSKNVSLGYLANGNNTTGSGNVAAGYLTGILNTTGANNTYIGNSAGYSNTGSGNVFLGNYAGYSETGSNKLYISNSNTASPLIYGDFSNSKVQINDSLQSKYLKLTNGAANGYILQSDASGNASWVSSSSISGSGWTINGSNQYSTVSGNVGIGTVSPSYKLHVSGSARADSIYTTNFKMTYGAQSGYLLQSDAGGNGSWVAPSTLISDDWVTNGNNQYSTVSGNVGIGTVSPSYKLHVSGSARADSIYTTSFQMTSGAQSGYLLQSDASGNASWVSSSSLSSTSWATNGNNQYSEVSGNVGIGTTVPSSKLQVVGTASADTVNASYVTAKLIKLSYGAVNGYVLQSDASGNGSWVSSSSLFTNNWTTSGSNQYNALSGNVGIGTTNPVAKLYVKGVDSYGSLAIEGSSYTSHFNYGKDNSEDTYIRGGKSTSRVLINDQSSGNTVIAAGGGNVGIGTSSPKSTLDISGSESHKVTAVTTSNNSTTLGSSDYSIIYSGNTSGNSITLPSAASYAGRVYLIVNHSTGSITISTYYTASSTTSTSVSDGSTVQLMSDGSNWHKIN